MKNLFLTTTFLLLCAGFALAQTTPSSNPSSSGTSSTQDQMSQQPSTSSTQDTSSQTDKDKMGKQSTSDKGNKEKTITGCLESAGSSGQYMVKHKNKDITVVPSSSVSSEIANHVGHKVKLYGSWEAGAAGTETAMNQPSSTLPQSDQPGGTKGAAKTEGKNFRADKIEMVSDTCGGSSKSKDNTGASTPKPY